MTKFIEIFDASDNCKIINTDNIVLITVNQMAMCTIKLVDGTEIRTEIHKDTLLKQIGNN